MIQETKPLVRKLCVAVLIVSMFLCPLAHGGFVRISSAEVERQIYPTVPPVNPAIPTPIGTSIPEPKAIPTLGPGQYFEEENKLPQVVNPELLDETVGYSEILGNLGLYLVWSTSNDNEKRYFIIDEESKYLLLTQMAEQLRKNEK